MRSRGTLFAIQRNVSNASGACIARDQPVSGVLFGFALGPVTRLRSGSSGRRLTPSGSWSARSAAWSDSTRFPRRQQLEAFATQARWWESEEKFKANLLDLLLSAAMHGETRFIRRAVRDGRPVLDLSGEHSRHVRKLRDLGLAVESADVTALPGEAAETDQPRFSGGSTARRKRSSPRSFRCDCRPACAGALPGPEVDTRRPPRLA